MRPLLLLLCTDTHAPTHLSDELVVWPPHGDGSKQGLEVVRELASTTVLLAGRVKGHEDARVQVNIDISTEKPEWDKKYCKN